MNMINKLVGRVRECQELHRVIGVGSFGIVALKENIESFIT